MISLSWQSVVLLDRRFQELSIPQAKVLLAGAEELL
jgi:hypothetical protein